MGLDFVVGEFEFPPFVVEGDDFVGREGHRIEQGGEQELRREAFALVRDGAHGKTSGRRDGLAGAPAGAKFDQPVAGSEFLHEAQRHGALAVLGPRQPVALVAGSASQWNIS